MVTSRRELTETVEVPEGKRSAVYWLEVGGGRAHQSFAVPNGVKLILGTHRECDVVVSDRTVSAHHCEIACTDGLLWVRDLESKNGTYAGGARVRKAQLKRGSCFSVGTTALSVRGGEEGSIDEAPLPGVIGTSTAMMEVAAEVRQLARLSVPVLIRGATGTGKDVVARALHLLSRRSNRPFVPINIGAIPPSLAASELFGHDRGAFTGAGNQRRGAFLAAQHGTLFLDEIGEASPDVQIHLLRVLEQREVQPVGSDTIIPVNVRIVAATWVDLERAVEAGSFRKDLDQRRDELGEKHLTPSALGRLTAHGWPGNVRELNNVVTRAAVKSQGSWIRAREIEAAFCQSRHSSRRLTKAAAQALVNKCNGLVSVAARECGVPRSTFRGWLEGRRKR